MNMNEKVRQAILRVVDYNWASEQSDFLAQDLQDRPAHVFNDLRFLRDVLSSHKAAGREQEKNELTRAGHTSIWRVDLMRPGRSWQTESTYRSRDLALKRARELKGQNVRWNIRLTYVSFEEIMP